MKEFEKWLKQEDYEHHSTDGGWPDAAWRAALKWALSLKEPDHTDIFYVINPTLIEKELQNE